LNFDELFALNEKKIFEKDYLIGNVHSIKGETFDAVLFIVRDSTTYRKLYKNIINDKIEELRIVYVAITRPRKILVIAVPKKDKPYWENKFNGA